MLIFGEEPIDLEQGSDALFQKEGIAFGSLDQQALEWAKAGVVAEESFEQLVGGGGRERVETELSV
jgi:hypothetical protein